MTGTLYGLGVGPGDPELMTLKVVRPAQFRLLSFFGPISFTIPCLITSIRLDNTEF